MRTKVISVVLCLGVILGLTLLPGAPLKVTSANPANEWGFEIQPSVTGVGWDEDFTVNAAVVQQGDGNSTSWHMYLLFDPTYLEVTGIDTPSTLPTGDTPDVELGVPAWDNTAGWAKHGYSRPTGGSEVDTGFVYCTIHFHSKSVNGASYLNFTVVNPLNQTDILDLHSTDILNWDYVVNGTVMVGTPSLTVDVNPAGKGDVEIEGVIPGSYPDTTSWSGGEVVDLEAIDSVAGWGFANWSGDLSGNTNPTTITMDAFTKTVTANFVELPPDWGFEIEPNMTAVGCDEDFTVNAAVVRRGGGNSTAWHMYLLFNTTYFEVTGIDTPSTLPTGDTPDVEPGMPDWDNTAGWAQHGYSRSTGGPEVDTGFVYCTIHFHSKNVTGTSYLNFTTLDPRYRTDILDAASTDVLNWSHVVNGTVEIGLPAISVSPTSLSFTTTEGANPAARTLEVWNSGYGTLSWSLTDNAGWLSENPTSGSSTGERDSVTVSVNVAGMAVGDYSAIINITGSALVEVPVSLHITAAAEAVIPGVLGVPAIEVLPAGLSASGLSISPQQVQPGQEVTISINVANTGGETGSYNAILYINEVVEDSQTVSVAAGTSKNVIFTVSKSQAGVYDVSLAGQSGQFEVVGGGLFGGGLGTGGIIAIVVIVIALIVAVIFILRGTARPE